jgi:SSS family solute:Na+ symporter
MIMAVFWLLLYVLVNLTSILYLGTLAISSISGLDITLCMIFLAFCGDDYTGRNESDWIYGCYSGFFLILGGLVTTYFSSEFGCRRFGSTGL